MAKLTLASARWKVLPVYTPDPAGSFVFYEDIFISLCLYIQEGLCLGMWHNDLHVGVQGMVGKQVLDARNFYCIWEHQRLLLCFWQGCCTGTADYLRIRANKEAAGFIGFSLMQAALRPTLAFGGVLVFTQFLRAGPSRSFFIGLSLPMTQSACTQAQSRRSRVYYIQRLPGAREH